MSPTNSRRLSPVTGIASGLNGFSLSSAPSERSIIDLTYDLERIDGWEGYLGAGGYADVYKYRARPTSTMYAAGRIFAVKSTRYFNRDAKKATLRTGREMNIWASLNHENILKLHGFVWIHGNPLPCFVSDYMENGTARNYLKGDSDVNLIRMIRDIAKGLLYVHERGIAHGDIKSDNILIGWSGRAKIGDFGISRMLGEDGRAKETSTTDANRSNRWTACEFIKPSSETSPPPPCGPTRSGDVWSFGCVVLELFSGQLPFYDVKEPAVTMQLYNDEVPKFPPTCLRQEFERYREEIVAFCSLCWIRNPEFRPSMGILEPIICSFCSGMDCGYVENEKPAPLAVDNSSPAKQAHSDSQRSPDPRVVDIGSGSRSRTSSGTTLVSIPSDEVPDIQILPPGSAEQPSTMSNSPLDPMLVAGTVEPHPNTDMPASPIPPPPPPTLETVLRSMNRNAQAVLNELSSTSLGVQVEFIEGASTGEAHNKTHTYSCRVNNEEYGIGSVQGRKKVAKEMAALRALGRLYNEDASRFPILQYFPVLKDHLRSHGLATRFQFASTSTILPGSEEYRVFFFLDGERRADGVGPTLPSAEEDVARHVAASWSQLFGTTVM